MDPNEKLNFHLGLVVDIPLSTTMGLQTGAIFSRKGWEFDLSELKEDLDEGESIKGYFGRGWYSPSC